MQKLIPICAISLFLIAWTEAENVTAVYFINLINSNQSAWKAGMHTVENMTTKALSYKTEDVDIVINTRTKNKTCELGGIEIPETFDARTKWPACSDVIGKIRKQGASYSCWAFAATEVMSDRLCIQTAGNIKFEFSPQDIVTCCQYCLGRTNGSGYQEEAWRYFTEFGVVSGGDYDSDQGCKPFKESTYFYNKQFPCNDFCENADYNISYKEDKRYGSEYYLVNKSQQCIQTEIMEKGPVQAILKVYEDLSYYKHGVYFYTIGAYVGLHSVKILGWGTEKGVPYWLVANSWGCEWGSLNGFFKIKRGQNECGIEQFIVAGNPRLDLNTANSSYIPNDSYTTSRTVWWLACILVVFITISLITGIICVNKKLRTLSVNYLRFS